MGTLENIFGATRKSDRFASGERRLLWASLVGIIVAICIGLPMPANAAGNDGSAEKLRRLDIMLMVTGLRCRTTADNFTADYGDFTRHHLSELNEASNDLKTDLARRYGAKGANRALDRMSVVMANEYGGGHPWLTCAELKDVTRSLVRVQGRETLVEAAGQLLSRQPAPLLALATR
ncbi:MULTISPECIES: hypothetical protein [unclassified Novosphingobium]|uniref:hypothetical protein n=1 Tax=unclassified Novosphingobium TaxID=2644732 RepID=UPI00020EEEBB|nr:MULTISPECIES: hypothetical protein [unclassified Novosphingobium]BBA74000.1 S-adenosyl-L-homocysteine hydrolase [Novosphingobium sp. PY1]GFM31237.1 S-adenosyl-L-homocysteine hydrolase [Novosphingobium sp. PY1]CCA93713.1 S-adenosyl-L-homocysteine hydrolase [Novosphingobium sp. PP1Y]